jgi:hypothetical protein
MIRTADDYPAWLALRHPLPAKSPLEPYKTQNPRLGDLQWIKANSKSPRQPWEIETFSSFMERYAPDSDPETLTVFTGLF